MDNFEAYRTWLTRDLAARPRRDGVAFSAACAERLYASTSQKLKAASGSTDHLLRDALDAAWQVACTGTGSEDGLQALYEHLVNAIPAEGDADPEDLLEPLIEDTLTLIAYAVVSAIGLEPRVWDWVSQVVFDALDHYLTDRDIVFRGDPTGRKAMLREFWEHPHVQTEVARQRRDLEELAGMGPSRSVVEALEDRSKREPLFPVL